MDEDDQQGQLSSELVDGLTAAMRATNRSLLLPGLRAIFWDSGRYPTPLLFAFIGPSLTTLRTFDIELEVPASILVRFVNALEHLLPPTLERLRIGGGSNFGASSSNCTSVLSSILRRQSALSTLDLSALDFPPAILDDYTSRDRLTSLDSGHIALGERETGVFLKSVATSLQNLTRLWLVIQTPPGQTHHNALTLPPTVLDPLLGIPGLNDFQLFYDRTLCLDSTYIALMGQAWRAMRVLAITNTTVDDEEHDIPTMPFTVIGDFALAFSQTLESLALIVGSVDIPGAQDVHVPFKALRRLGFNGVKAFTFDEASSFSGFLGTLCPKECRLYRYKGTPPMDFSDFDEIVRPRSTIRMPWGTDHSRWSEICTMVRTIQHVLYQDRLRSGNSEPGRSCGP